MTDSPVFSPFPRSCFEVVEAATGKNLSHSVSVSLYIFFMHYSSHANYPPSVQSVASKWITIEEKVIKWIQSFFHRGFTASPHAQKSLNFTSVAVTVAAVIILSALCPLPKAVYNVIL